MPEVGEKVTVRVRWLASFPLPTFARGTVDGRLEQAFDPGDGQWKGMAGFSVKMASDAPSERVNLWEVDPDFVEGVGWARGWDGPAVEALRVAEALA